MEQKVLVRMRSDLCEWLIHDDGLPLSEGLGSIEEAARAARETFKDDSEFEAAVLLEGEAALMMSITVPAKPTRQLLDAIPFLVEEKIAGNVDDCFIALGQRQDDRLAVVVLARQKVKDTVDACASEGLAVSFLGVDAQIFQDPHSLRLVLESDQVQFIHPSGEGVSIRADLAEKVLVEELADQNSDIECFDFCESKPLLSTTLAASPIQFREFSAREGTIEPSLLRMWLTRPAPLAVNLRQGKFSYRSTSVALTSLFKRISFILGLLLGSQLLSSLAQALYLDHQATQLERDAQELYLSIYPQDIAPKDMVRRWRSRLAGPGNANQPMALELVEKVSSKIGQSGLTLQNLNYNVARGDVSMQLVGKTSEQVVRLSESLGSTGLESEVGTISQEDNEVRATLRVRNAF